MATWRSRRMLYATASTIGYLSYEQHDWLADFDVASWGAKLKGEGREWKCHFRYLPS